MEQLGLDQQRIWPFRGLGLGAIQLGRRGDATGWLDRAEELARRGNRRLYLYNVLIAKAGLAIAEGRYAEAKRLAAEVRDIGGTDNSIIILGYRAQVTAIRVEEGQYDTIIDDLTSMASDPSPGTVAWRAMLAGVSADLGRLDEAAEQFETLSDDRFAIVPRDWAFPLAIRYLAETCAQLGDVERAAQLLPEVQPYSGQLLVVTIGTSMEAAADRSLGQLFGLLGRIEEADRHYEAAWRLEDTMGFSPLAARSRYWHGCLLAQSGRPDDRRRARRLLQAARTVSHKLGMPVLHQQASTLSAMLEDQQHRGRLD